MYAFEVGLPINPLAIDEHPLRTSKVVYPHVVEVVHNGAVMAANVIVRQDKVISLLAPESK